MNISIKIDNSINKIDVSSEVDINTIQIGERSDFSFERGTFTLITSQITYNIPPYSLCKIDDDIYTIYSEATKNLVSGKWVHTCHLMALESILECFIVGTKAFRNQGYTTRDSDIMSELSSLMQGKYNLSNLYVVDDTNTLITVGHEYTFGTGTTLYECVRQIAIRNDIQFKLVFSDFVSWDDNYSDITYSILFYDPASAPTLTIASNSTFLMNVEYSQDSNNYCKRLETEARNVVDRDKDTIFGNLTVRASNGVAINADKAEILLPTNVEAITKFEVVTSSLNAGRITTQLNNVYMDGYAHTNPFAGTTSSTSGFMIYDGTLKQFMDADFRAVYQSSVGTINLFQKMWDEFFSTRTITDENNNVLTYNDIFVHTSIGQYQGVQTFIINFSSNNNGGIYANGGVMDYTDYVAEEAEWMALPPSEQPKYVAYKKGSNVLYNLNATYHDDLWGNILGITVHNFLYYAGQIKTVDLISNGAGFVIVFKGAFSTNPLDFSYNVTCVPITNPIVIDTKNISSMLNESSQKDYGRSYQIGDSNNLPIYLDAMITDMDKQNETLGLIEASVDIDTTNFVTLPTANSEISLFNQTFYVYSLSKRYTTTKKYMTLNLSRNRFKICDAIGVDYQFNSTKFPLENIVDRPIYMSVDNTNLYNALATTNDYAFVKFIFYDYRTVAIATLVKRLAVQIVGNSAYCYVEALDNIVFDTKAVPDNGVYACDNMTYCDDNGECYYVRANVFTTKSVMSLADSYLLPDPSALNNITIENDTQVVLLKHIAKDVAERLTFTIQVNKSN